MTVHISQRELRNESGEVFRRIHEGDDFVVTSRGRPVATLRPIGETEQGTRREPIRELDLRPENRVQTTLTSAQMLEGLRDER